MIAACDVETQKKWKIIQFIVKKKKKMLSNAWQFCERAKVFIEDAVSKIYPRYSLSSNCLLFFIMSIF